jgi:hypothetical protein
MPKRESPMESLREEAEDHERNKPFYVDVDDLGISPDSLNDHHWQSNGIGASRGSRSAREAAEERKGRSMSKRLTDEVLDVRENPSPDTARRLSAAMIASRIAGPAASDEETAKIATRLAARLSDEDLQSIVASRRGIAADMREAAFEGEEAAVDEDDSPNSGRDQAFDPKMVRVPADSSVLQSLKGKSSVNSPTASRKADASQGVAIEWEDGCEGDMDELDEDIEEDFDPDADAEFSDPDPDNSDRGASMVAGDEDEDVDDPSEDAEMGDDDPLDGFDDMSDLGDAEDSFGVGEEVEEDESLDDESSDFEEDDDEACGEGDEGDLSDEFSGDFGDGGFEDEDEFMEDEFEDGDGDEDYFEPRQPSASRRKGGRRASIPDEEPTDLMFEEAEALARRGVRFGSESYGMLTNRSLGYGEGTRFAAPRRPEARAVRRASAPPSSRAEFLVWETELDPELAELAKEAERRRRVRKAGRTGSRAASGGQKPSRPTKSAQAPRRKKKQSPQAAQVSRKRQSPQRRRSASGSVSLVRPSRRSPVRAASAQEDPFENLFGVSEGDLSKANRILR